jgi:ankyrin repeat protein
LLQANLQTREISNLFDSVRKGDEKRVTEILEREPELRQLQDREGRSLPWIAAASNNRKLIPLLVDPKSEPDIFDLVALNEPKKVSDLVRKYPVVLNTVNRAGISPLLAAAECGSSACLESLVGVGAQLEHKKSSEPSTALLIALQYPEIKEVNWMVQVLLGNGANPAAKLPDGTTALHLAAKLGDPFSVKMLIRKGADKNAKNSFGQTPLDVAQTPEIQKLLTSQIPLDFYITRYKKGNSIDSVDNSTTSILPYSLVNEFVTLAHFDLERTKRFLKQIPELLNLKATWDEISI